MNGTANRVVITICEASHSIPESGRAEKRQYQVTAVIVTPLGQGLPEVFVVKWDARLGGNIEETALNTNLESADEIAKQLRIRDLAGLIVIDFIDMHTAEHRQKLYEHLRNEMAFDKTKHKILPPSKFGLVQITRQRVRPELIIKTHEPNPSGSGEVEAPIVLIDKIKTDLDKIISSKEHKKIYLNALEKGIGTEVEF